MLADEVTTNRIAVFAELIDTAKSSFGRTALMKLCYFLQTLKSVELGYDFTLYSYGPFDSEVLADLRTAEDLSVIESEVTSFSGGYQYRLSTSHNAPLAKRTARSYTTTRRADIQWVVDKFAHRSASELELLSTIVYVDRHGRILTHESIRDKVKLIKPHFSVSEISKKIAWLQSEHLLLVSDMPAK